MKNFFCFVSILFFGNTFSQVTLTRKSNVYIQTIYHSKPHFSLAQTSLVFFNSAQQELFLEIDFADFKSEVDSLDEWLVDLTASKLVVKATVNEEQITGLHNNESRTLHLSSLVSLNGITHTIPFNFTIFEISQQGLQYQNIQDNVFDRLRFNCVIVFMPKDFGVNKKPHHLKKSISLSFGNGFINYVKH